MKRFILQTTLLWLLLIALCGGVIAIRHTNAGPNELQTRGFDRCGGQPCYLGIQPGVTSWKDAQTLLPDSIYRPSPVPSGHLSATIETIPCKLKSVVCVLEYRFDLDSKTSPITAGMLVEKYGIPDAVSLNGNNELGFSYRGLFALVLVEHWDRLDVNSPVMSIGLETSTLDQPPEPCQQEAVRDMFVGVCWHGLAVIGRYWLDH